MEKITFTNSNNVSIEFGPQFPYLLGNVSGIGEVPLSVQTDSAYGIDGNIYYDTIASPRLIKFDFWFNATTHSALHTARRTIQSILNAKLGQGEIIYENDIGKWRIDAAVFDGPVMLSSKPNDRMRTFQHVEVAFVCEQPLWKSFVEYSTLIVGFTGGLTFPLSFPISFAETADNVVINNTGDDDTPLIIEFRGPATGCKIEKLEAGEFVEVTYTLEEGEKLIIDTNHILTKVTFVAVDGTETSAFNKINAASTFFQLTPGNNTIAFTSVSGTPTVYLYWYLRYLGV